MSTPQSLNHFRQYGPGAGDVLFETTKLEISQSQSQSSALDLDIDNNNIYWHKYRDVSWKIFE